MALEFYTVNAFANSPHTGSQAAVVLIPPNDSRWSDDTYLKAVAGDFAWPATVYISPLEAEGPSYKIRWFTKEGVGLAGVAF
jgi:predicted PhzF superfamily epimerase YddE/YHI9